MKKVLLIIFCLLFIFAQAETLKGGVFEEYVPKGFYGSWGVISKLKSTNNPSRFNYESRDIWVLSGQGNTLILQNIESGAYSEITVQEKSVEGKTLRFSRQKVLKRKDGKEIHKESVEFTLFGKNFSGTDNFIVESYDKNDNFIKSDNAVYSVEGVRISGSE